MFDKPSDQDPAQANRSLVSRAGRQQSYRCLVMILIRILIRSVAIVETLFGLAETVDCAWFPISISRTSWRYCLSRHLHKFFDLGAIPENRPDAVVLLPAVIVALMERRLQDAVDSLPKLIE